MSTAEQEPAMLANERIARLIRRELDVEPIYVAEFDLSTIDLKSRKQVRDTNEAPKEQVDAYTWMMDEGDVFPAIVVCQDPDNPDSIPVLDDGNTRVQAHRNRGERWTTAYVIPIDYHTADAKLQARIDYIGGALNAKNGRPNSRSERDMLIINGVLAGKADKEIATTAGVTVQTVANARDRALATNRLRETGIERAELAHLKDTSISKFGKAIDLPDDLFAETARLADSAGMNASEVTSLINSVREAGSQELAHERLARERKDWEPRIEEISRGNGGGPKPLAGQLRRSLGFITKNPAVAFVEHNADHAVEHEALVEQAIARLNEVLKAQQQVNADLRAKVEAGASAGA